MMRDMQAQYSRYLNKKYADRPDLLLAPLMGERARRKFSKFLRAGSGELDGMSRGDSLRSIESRRGTEDAVARE